ncbi:MAG: amidohydrolase family protein [Candidatus Electrothrix sp. Rat3]|nr:amidohydrolase family protein [Candidatus Electrothrix rattekaaiensis]
MIRGTGYILAGRFIDGSGAKVRRSILLEVKDGFIIALQPAASVPRHTPIDDLSHCTVVPVLLDCSVSLLQSPSVNGVRLSLEGETVAKQEDIQEDMLARHIRYCSAHGILGVVANDKDKHQLLQKYRRKRGQSYGIDIRTAHDGADADVLRLIYSPNIEEEAGGSLQLNYENLCRILRNRGEKKVIVVANGSQQVAEALEAGCDAIEQGYGMGEANIRMMAAKDVLWIPSAVRAKNALDASSSGGSVCCRFSTRYVAPSEPAPGAEVFWKKILAEQLAQLSLARKLGVKTAVGTGAGSVGILHGESVVDEIKLFIKAGYSLEKSIQCASKNSAEFFGMQHGRLAVGQRATFLLTRGTAGQLPRKLSYLEGVYVDGLPSRDYRK